MDIIGISVNHRTAPIGLRESLYLNSNETAELIPELKKRFLREGFVLSTCNRTEIFGFPKEGHISSEGLIEFFADFKGGVKLKNENLERYFSCGAVHHLFRVASGIDSLMIGDSQILGQVKDAFERSLDLQFAGPFTKRLFDNTLRVGKRAIKETSIGQGAVTVSYAAVQVVEKIFASLDKKSVLIIGAGETAELAAVHMADRGIGEIAIANRTLERAENLAKKVHGEIVPFESLADNLSNFDIIISATSSEDIIISHKDVKKMMKKRRGAPVCMMDIAMPRDIDPKVKSIDNVFYHDIDSLDVIVKQNLRKREKEIPVVENIIMEEMTTFFGWFNSLEVVPTIKTMREFFEEIRDDELRKIKHKVTEEDYLKLEDMTRRLIGRLLHNPTIKLKEVAETGTNAHEVHAYSMIIKNLFGLNGYTENNEDDTNIKHGYHSE